MGGGSNTTSVTIPKWLEDAVQENIASAKNVSKIGYTPYYGPDVAAMTPAQIAAMQGTNQMATAFGMPTADVTAGMPTATDYNGMPAYSSGGLYDQALAELKARRPGQYAAITGMFIDPVTGKVSYSGSGSQNAAIAASGGGGGASQNTGMTYGGEGADRYSYSSMQNGSADPRSGTGSFGLPDPMSGQITSIGNIGRPGSLVNNIADAVSNLFAGATASSSNNNSGGNSGGSSSGSSGGSSGQRSESRR